MLQVNILLTMAKDINSICPIAIGEVLVIPLSYSFKGHFRSIYPPISL
jgi:hypothetical protein